MAGEATLEAYADNLVTPDGAGWYSPDFSKLVKYEGTAESYAIDPRCEEIAASAFNNHDELHEVSFPEGLRDIGDFAFLASGIRSFVAPASLRRIGEKAFFRGAELQEAVLNDGLEYMSPEAFAGTAIERLAIPASVRFIGRWIAADTPLSAAVAQGEAERFSVAAENPDYFVCPHGGLYRRMDGKILLVDGRLVGAREYHVLPGTREVSDSAFFMNMHVGRVIFPEGLVRIADFAFFRCLHLQEVVFPETLAKIGDRAFSESPILEVRFPAALQDVHPMAFLRASGPPEEVVKEPIAKISVDPGNPVYFMESGLLCEHVEGGTRVMCYASDESIVTAPADTVEFSPCAFLNASGIEILNLREGDWTYELSSFTMSIPPRWVYLHFPEKRDGHRFVRAYFGHETSGSRFFVSVFVHKGFSAQRLMVYSDIAVNKEPDTFKRFRAMVNRLADPYLILDADKTLFERIILESLETLCASFASRRYWKGFDQLVECGLLDEKELTRAIDILGTTDNPEAVAYALELKRKHFGERDFDYSVYAL